MSPMLLYGGVVLAVVFIGTVSVWAWLVIVGSARADRENHRKQRLQDEQVARAREELIKRYQ